MKKTQQRKEPGVVRDAIINVLSEADEPLSATEVSSRVADLIGETPESSVRSYLLLNTPGKFRRSGRGLYELPQEDSTLEVHEEAVAYYDEASFPDFSCGKSRMFNADCFDWLDSQPANSFHAIVTDPPYGLREYTPEELGKLRSGHGGVWRLPPSFDGSRRSPLPRFTVLDGRQRDNLYSFFRKWGQAVLPRLVPGANVIMASNPLLSYVVSSALASAGLERRGEIVRLTMTMRGGDRPKNAEQEFDGVSVMPRSMWEPWLVFRKPLEGRVQDNLRKWGTGGFRRIGPDKPFGDVIKSSPTGKNERGLAPHPSLKPQAFLRQIVRASLPLGRGCVLDTFAGSGSTLAAAEAVGYDSVGVERDRTYFELACGSIPKLSRFRVGEERDTTTLPLVF
ncbi:MAG: site-specific DNA-methyltransferase [Kiritimatiellae bacterium]|nr:site-specific DNA-methyltransferase [Kiritimatiellia bacterium]